MSEQNDDHTSPKTPEGAAPHRPMSTETRVVRDRKGVRHKVEVPSTGHNWDGIEEYDNPLPRWWLWTFYGCIVWALAYVVAYPAIPLLTHATQGLIGTTNRQQVAADIQKFAEANAPIQAKLVATPLDKIADDPELANYTANAGAAIFRTWCAQCHGSGAGGASGYPTLLDNDWLWGGSIDAIHNTIEHGIRDPKDADTRYSEMPKFGADGLLDKTQIGQVVNYVLELGGRPHDAGLAAAGKAIFAENCTACHGEDGHGDRAQGAPNLTDAVWLYGNDPATLTRIVHDGPYGVMPAWSGRLSEADIRAVASYVHGLGGGE